MVSNSFYPIIGQTMGPFVPAVVYSMDNINRGQDGASGKYIRPEWLFRNFHTRTEEPYIKEVETVRKLYDLVLRAQNEGLDIVSLFQTEWGGTRWHESLRLRAEGVDGRERAIEEFRDFNKPKEKRKPKARGRIEGQLE